MAVDVKFGNFFFWGGLSLILFILFVSLLNRPILATKKFDRPSWLLEDEGGKEGCRRGKGRVSKGDGALVSRYLAVSAVVSVFWPPSGAALNAAIKLSQ